MDSPPVPEIASTPPSPDDEIHETALDWLRRTRRKRKLKSRTPWSFETTSPSTGIAFIDALWSTTDDNPEDRRSSNHFDTSRNFPVTEIRGSVGKTRTLTTLAACFLVDTLPYTKARVVWVDPFYDLPPPFHNATSESRNQRQRQQLSTSSHPIVTAIQHQLTMRSGHAASMINNDGALTTNTLPTEEQLEASLCNCIRRLHKVTPSSALGDVGWVPLLECLRYELDQEQQTELISNKYDDDQEEGDDIPTLILWDNFLEDLPAHDKSVTTIRAETIRQVVRLMEQCPVVLVTTTDVTDDPSRADWNKHITHWARTERVADDIGASTDNKHQDSCYRATLHDGSQVPFAISPFGVK